MRTPGARREDLLDLSLRLRSRRFFISMDCRRSTVCVSVKFFQYTVKKIEAIRRDDEIRSQSKSYFFYHTTTFHNGRLCVFQTD